MGSVEGHSCEYCDGSKDEDFEEQEAKDLLQCAGECEEKLLKAGENGLSEKDVFDLRFKRNIMLSCLKDTHF